MSYAKWLQSNAPTYLQDEWGQAWMGGIGDLLDEYVSQIVAGAQASFPQRAPADAIPVIGDEMGLDQGIYETTADYANRLRFAWVQWKFAGTPLGLLMALHFLGFDGALVVQQNGKAYQLTTPLPAFGAGWDPTDNLVITTLGENPQITGSPSWWTFDLDDSFCSRFAILFPDGAAPFSTHGRATFSGTDESAVTWNNPMESTSYRVIIGAPVVTDGTTPIIGYSSLTETGLTAEAGGPFNGYVDFWAYPDTSVNPFAWLRSGHLQRLQNTIEKWRPGKATCMGVDVLVAGKFWDWPVMTFDDWKNTGGKWGGSTVVHFAGA